MINVLCCLLFAFSVLFSEHALAVDTKVIEQKLEQHQNNLPKGDIKQISHIKTIIKYMYDFDQELRALFIKHQHDKQIGALLKKLDAFHTYHIKAILEIHGWIVISKFGIEYDQKAWLLVQHADHDPFFQAGVLFLLERLAHKGETDPKNYTPIFMIG